MWVISLSIPKSNTKLGLTQTLNFGQLKRVIPENLHYSLRGSAAVKRRKEQRNRSGNNYASHGPSSNWH